MTDTPDAKDRCARYRDRLDAHLVSLPNDAARRSFLACEADKWQDRYSSFIAAVDSGTYTGSATAFDFTITIADVDSRLGKLSRVAEPVA